MNGLVDMYTAGARVALAPVSRVMRKGVCSCLRITRKLQPTQ